MTATTPYRTYLSEQQIPTAWYNLRADMPEKPEPMRLPSGEVATHADLAPIFADALIDQELDDETAYFDIPEPVREMYKVYRPSPAHGSRPRSVRLARDSRRAARSTCWLRTVRGREPSVTRTYPDCVLVAVGIGPQTVRNPHVPETRAGSGRSAAQNRPQPARPPDENGPDAERAPGPRKCPLPEGTTRRRSSCARARSTRAPRREATRRPCRRAPSGSCTPR